MNKFTTKVLPVVLALASAAGTIGTAVLAVKATPKAMKKIDELKETNPNPSKKDIIKATYKCYIPAASVATATIASTTTSFILSKKTEASLSAATVMLNQGWNKYKYKVKELFGDKAHEAVTNAISQDEYKAQKNDIPADSRQLYWEEHLGFFKCDPLDLASAMSDMNQRLHAPDPDDEGTYYWTTLYILARDAKAEVLDKTKLEACKKIGWTADYLLEVSGPQSIWVHPNYVKACDKKTGELRYTKIFFWEEPIVMIPSELRRDNYRARKQFEHNAEIDEAADMEIDAWHRYETVDEDVIMDKVDCDRVNDDLCRFIACNPNSKDASDVFYVDGTRPGHEDEVIDINMPDPASIPTK